MSLNNELKIDRALNSMADVNSGRSHEKSVFEDKDATVPELYVNRVYVWSSSLDNGSEISNGTPQHGENVSKDEIPTVATVNNSTTRTENSSIDGNKDVDEACKLGCIQLECCQRFRSAKWFVLVFTLCGAIQVSSFHVY